MTDEKEYEYFTGKGTYDRNDLEIGIHDGQIYVDIDSEYTIVFPLREAKRMSRYLQRLIKEVEK